MALLEIEDLHTHFFTEEGVVRAVDGLSLQVERGEVLCVVGESGSGKTVASLSIMRLVPDPPGRIVSGRIVFHPSKGKPLDLVTAPESALRALRGNRIAMVFQDPMTSLNPYLKVRVQLGEVLELHRGLRGERVERAMVAMLRQVGIAGPEGRLHAYPHELSGGMRQRVMIAMALLCEPELLIADEPTTALDVTVQAQILSLVAERKAELGLGLLWITHDLGVVARMADRVAVMYAGRIVEQGTVHAVLGRPLHPYTMALLRSVPRLDDPAGQGRLAALEGLPPSLVDPIEGCPFRPRCDRALEICAADYPAVRLEDDGAHQVCCHWKEEAP